MSKYYYRYINGSKWILLTGEGNDPKHCDITWESSDNAVDDLREVLSEETIFSPVYGHVSVTEGEFKDNMYTQVIRMAPIIRLGYKCEDYSIPELTAKESKGNINKFEVLDEFLKVANIDSKEMSPDQIKTFFAKLEKKGLLNGKPGDKKSVGTESTDKAPEGAQGSGKSGLVKKKVTVKRDGRTFEQERWVKAGEDESEDKPKKGDETGEKPESKSKPEESKGPAIQGLNKPASESEISPSSTMTKDNVDEIVSLADMGVKGGIHKDVTSVVKFKGGECGIHKKIADINIFGETKMYDTAKILNYNVVPETITGDLGKGHGSCQRWIKDTEGPYDEFALKGCKIDERHFDDLSKIFVVDMIVGNIDRHMNNVVIGKKDSKCWAIDNENWGQPSGKRAMLALDDETNFKDEYYSPMMKWMRKILAPEPGVFEKKPEDGGKASREKAFAGFKEKVIENLKVALDSKEEIISSYSSFKGEGADERIANIKDNIEYLEKYIVNMPTVKSLSIGDLQKALTDKLIHVRAGKGHKAYVRTMKVGTSGVAEVKPEVKPKTVETTLSYMSNPDNVQSVTSLQDLGVSGGFHEFDTHMVVYKDGSHALYKVMEKKGIKGELVTYGASEILNWNIVPATTSVNFMGKGEGSCQKWIEGGKEPYAGYNDESVRIKERHLDNISKIFLMDTLLSNWDRHERNVVIKDDQIYAIDNEFTVIKTTERFLDALDNHEINTATQAWLKANDVNLNSFKEHVIENMYDIVDKGSEIVAHVEASGVDEDIVTCIKDNLKNMKQYYRKNVDIPDPTTNLNVEEMEKKVTL